jgi:hypothetical protein
MTYQIEVEYTDTFGGEPNYCWVRRATLDVEQGTSARAIMRRAKAAVGINGMRGRGYRHGDEWEFRPYRCCTVMLTRVLY